MPKAMLFVDGTWLYCNVPRLSEVYGQPDFRVHFGKLPGVLANEAEQLVGAPIDLVRTHLIGSFADNQDPADEEAVQRRRDFFDLLRDEYHYEIETYGVNFQGRRLRRADREPGDVFEPKEKCVDVALATQILYNAAVPDSYELAIVVVGDADYAPALQAVRRLGKRVVLVSIKGSCAPSLADPVDEIRVKDFDTLWLDDMLERLELTYESHTLICESPNHEGDREVETTFHPRKGQRFYCDDCRQHYSRSRRELADTEPAEAGALLVGVVRRIISDRGYGFIETDDGFSYFFHLTDLDGLHFDDLTEGLSVEFQVKKRPSADHAGAAAGVRSAP